MIQYNFEPPALLLGLFCIIYCLMKRRRLYTLQFSSSNPEVNQHTLFFLLLIMLTASSFFSLAALHLEKNAIWGLWKLEFAFDMFYFVFHIPIAAIYVLYVISLNGANIHFGRKFYLIALAPLFVCECLIVSNPFTHWIFSVSPDGVYYRGPALVVLYIVTVMYVGWGTSYYYINKRTYSPSNNRIIILFVLISFIGIVLQLVNSGFLIETFAETLSFLGFLLTLEDTEYNIDPLTGVYHRVAFDEENRKRLKAAQEYSILHIHLDNLTVYSHLLTAKGTDHLIADIAKWLTTLTRRDNIFSSHNQNFMIIVNSPDVADAKKMAETIMKRFESPWQIEDMYATLDVSIGILQMPDDVMDGETLDHLLEILSEIPGNGSRFITSDDIELYKRQLLIERLLSRAIENRSIEVWYQPIWSADTNSIVSAECLARLIDNEYGFIPPDEFIPIAEKTGMILDLGDIIFEKSCEFIKKNNLSSLGIEYLEINLSVYQFLQEDLEAHLHSIMDKYGIPETMINLEVTESQSSDQAPVIYDTMHSMLSNGFTFSLDDYGTGYSNMQRLVSSEFKNIKIDKSILWDADKNPKSQHLLEYLIRTIRALGMNIVQEGVETEEQLEMVTRYGCNLVQGYFFSKPVKEDPFIDYVKKFNKISA